MMTPEDRRAAYEQDWENLRYQDGLRWSRFQTVSAIEGAYLAVLYATSLDHARGLVLAVFAFALVFFIAVLAVKDARHARAHMSRAKKLEGSSAMDIPDLEKPQPVLGLSGHETMLVAIVLVNVFNVGVIVDQIVKLCGSA